MEATNLPKSMHWEPQGFILKYFCQIPLTIQTVLQPIIQLACEMQEISPMT